MTPNMRLFSVAFIVLAPVLTSHTISGDPVSLKNLDTVIEKAVRKAILEYCPKPAEESGKSGLSGRAHADCPAGFTACAGRCYSAVEALQNYTAAERSCAALGAALAVPRSRAENLCVAGLSGGRRVWLGVTDRAQEGVFVGADGTPEVELPGHRWADGQPDDFTLVDPDGEHCVEMATFARLADWNDESCHSELNPMCELRTERV